MQKIKILGAGISGLTAAINLAKAGYDVNQKSGMFLMTDFGKRVF